MVHSSLNRTITNKQNNFIKDNSNLAASNKIFEVPSVQASQTGAKILENNTIGMAEMKPSRIARK